MKPRLIDLPHVYNSRDLGGYQAKDGRQVKFGRLFRTALLHDLTDAGLAKLDEMNVTRIIDFRDNSEVSQLPDRLPNSATYYHLPVFKEDETGASLSTAKPSQRLAIDYDAGTQWMLRAYHDMVTIESAQQAYQSFFQQLLAVNDHEATIFHCTAGKDRTGMAAYFLLRTLGISKNDAQQDYLWTNVYSAPRLRKRIESVKNAGGNEVVITNVIRMSSASPAYLNLATKLIETNYGTMDQFAHDFLDLSVTDINDLKQLYLA